MIRRRSTSSRPLMRGITMSAITRAIWPSCPNAALSASSPLAASSTLKPARARIFSSRSRTITSSSTTRIVSVLGSVIELRAHCRITGRADTMTELRVGVFGDVALQLLPVLIVAADALAVRTDRQESAQLLDVGQGGLQLFNSFGEAFLQRQDADADLHARAQLLGVERLGDVVVGAGVEPCHQIAAALARR